MVMEAALWWCLLEWQMSLAGSGGWPRRIWRWDNQKGEESPVPEQRPKPQLLMFSTGSCYPRPPPHLQGAAQGCAYDGLRGGHGVTQEDARVPDSPTGHPSPPFPSSD